ncbi:MAG: caspase domain-containing protein, partial [SAR324 cluster bacterium]|nr:caspase domain-containing protein [SAR324 cluster bacterium]
MKYIWLILVSLLLFISTILAQTSKGISRKDASAAAGSGPRSALVIGNADYESAPLRNPVNDAREIAKTLRGLGFSVQLLEDASQKQMKRAIDRFGEQLRDGGVGLFYYSGHGIQVSGRNYLVPLKAEIASEQDVEYESVDAGRVLAKMDAARNGMNLVILDACRNNPYARSFRSASQGLATLNAPSGTFIAYATAPGSVASDGTGRNGLYTGELVRHMNTPGLKLEEVFKRVRADVQEKSGNAQVPWDASSLTGDFFFVSPEEKPEPAADATLTPTPLPSSAASQFLADEELWKELKDSDSPVDFEDFLAAFPESKLAPVARIKLKRIKRKQAKAKAEEQQLAVEEKRQEEERKQLEAEKQKIAEAKRKAEKTLAEEAKLQSDSSLILTLSNPVQKTIIRNSKHPKGNVEITYSVWIKPDHYTGY